MLNLDDRDLAHDLQKSRNMPEPPRDRYGRQTQGRIDAQISAKVDEAPQLSLTISKQHNCAPVASSDERAASDKACIDRAMIPRSTKSLWDQPKTDASPVISGF